MHEQNPLSRMRRVSRLTFMNFCLVLSFLLTIFFSRDINHLINYAFPYGDPIDLFLLRESIMILSRLICIVAIVLDISWNCFIRGIARNSFRRLMPIGILIIFIAGVVFNNQISIARELIEFKIHEQEYDQVAAIGQKELKSSIGCVKYIELPQSISDTLGHKMLWVANEGNSYWIGLVQGVGERETDFFHIDGIRPKLGTLAGGCGGLTECYYQINDRWFLCTEYSPDI